ncbi:MAG: hypothetical protein EXQ79_05385 [Acidimicrobiia bacterium]|nr:hypothetical protein [Acidimicrobiia bacterium]
MHFSAISGSTISSVLLSALFMLSGVSAAAVADKKAPACAGRTRKAAIKSIEAAYDVVINGANPERTLEDKLALIEGADDAGLRATLEEVATAHPDDLATTTLKVQDVVCTGKRTAEVHFELVLDGELNRGLAPPGSAVVDDGLWKVTGATACQLVALADPTLLEHGPCARALASRP